MIVTTIADWVLSAMTWVVGLLPNTTTYPGLAIPDGALHGVGHYMSFVGLFVDMNALGTVVSVLCAYQIALLLIRLILWVYHVVRP